MTLPNASIPQPFGLSVKHFKFCCVRIAQLFAFLSYS